MGSAAGRALVGLCALAAGTCATAASPASKEIAQVAAGRRAYAEHCAVCHGARGEGAPDWARPNAYGEVPAPPHNARGHTWKHSDAMLYRIVQDGWRDPFNKTDTLTMPAFKGRLSHADTIAILAYLKTLWTSEQRRFQVEESQGHPFPSRPP